MTFKDILVHVDDSARSAIRFDLAVSLAAAHQAHLVALNVRSRSVMSPGMTALFGERMDLILAQGDAEAASKARALVEAHPVPPGVSVEWRDVAGDPTDCVALHARYSDLTIIDQTMEEEGGMPPRPASLVMAVGRPILVVPYAGKFPTMGKRVLVGWNATREATRAVHDALPILERADLVHIMAINPDYGMAGHGDVPGADICQHLSRHGVNAVCEHIISDDLEAGEMLLSRAADEDCDLMVMGGYGHSRLQEMVLGGVTRHLLGHMTIPVLFSH